MMAQFEFSDVFQGSYFQPVVRCLDIAICKPPLCSLPVFSSSVANSKSSKAVVLKSTPSSLLPPEVLADTILKNSTLNLLRAFLAGLEAYFYIIHSLAFSR